ncbi:unnamed protein product [Parnassius apollo]|uniref:(apollo) hypothetical protein n=1 Tax=Parnassius apollo TaxID=110799 RepID=A0A8S3YCS1_PARAO|nr:unnamed protein product [Parnassius apollo]
MIEIINCPLNENSWVQATLPIRLGGLGIRRVSSVALPVFLSSVHSTLDLIGTVTNPTLSDVEVSCLIEAKEAWINKAGPDQVFPTNPASQRHWDEPLSIQVQKNLLENCANPTERARLLAFVEKESGIG